MSGMAVKAHPLLNSFPLRYTLYTFKPVLRYVLTYRPALVEHLLASALIICDS